MEPAAGKRFLGRTRVLQVALHDDVAAHEDLTHRGTVRRNRSEAHRIGDRQALEHGVGDALARLEPRPLGRGRLVTFVVPGADDGRAIDLGATVDTGDVKAETIHSFDHCGGGCRTGGHHLDPPVERALQSGSRVEQHVHDDRRTAEMGHPFARDRLVDCPGLDPTQADMRPGERGNGPREAPAGWVGLPGFVARPVVFSLQWV